MPEPSWMDVRARERLPVAHLLFRADLREARQSAGANESAGDVAAKAVSRRQQWENAGLANEAELDERIEEAALAFFGPGVRAETTVYRGDSLEISILLVALGAVGTYRSHV